MRATKQKSCVAMVLGSLGLCLGASAASVTYDFNSDPVGDPSLTLRGPAKWVETGSQDGSGYISLTDAVNDQNGGTLVVNNPEGAPIAGFKAKFKIRVGGGSSQPADGFSFSFGTDPAATVGEEGIVDGLTINLDTYDNGGGEAPALDVKLNNVLLKRTKFTGIGTAAGTAFKDPSGNEVSLETGANFVDLEIDLKECGLLTVKYKGLEIYRDLATGYAIRDGVFILAARTGGLNDNHWIDDLTIETLPDPGRPTASVNAPTRRTDVRLTDAIEIKIADGAVSGLKPSSVVLKVDGAAVTPVVTGGAPETLVSYAPPGGWAPFTSHTVLLTFSDNATPSVAGCPLEFTFVTTPLTADTLVIEAEDFNYSEDGVNGGLHANFGDPDASLLGKGAVEGIDYNEVNDNNDQNIYRAPTGVEAGKLGSDDPFRGARDIETNYILGWNDAGDWWNYTRDFGPARIYRIYARLASGGADEHAHLDRVTSDPTLPDQTTETIGRFDSPATGNWDVFHFVPLRDALGAASQVRLSGLTTLRLVTDPGNFDANFLAFVPVEGALLRATPTLVAPTPNTTTIRDPQLKVVVADRDTKVVASSLKLTLDGVAVAGTVTDTAAGAEIVFQSPIRFAPGSTHTAKVEFKDDDTPAFVYAQEWSFRVNDFTSDTLFIEAEDFNYSEDGSAGGLFADFGSPDGSLLGKLAVDGIDYSEANKGNDQNIYRGGTAVEAGKKGTDDPSRGLNTNLENYIVGWNDVGDWYNYTRTFPNKRYNIYARISSGGADMYAKLDLVTGDATAPDQTLESLGEFRAPATGNWDVFTTVPLKTVSGDLANLRLNGLQTVRFSMGGGNLDYNYLALVPSEVQFYPPSIASLAPASGALTPHAPAIQVVIKDEDSKVVPGTIKLKVDGADVTAGSTVTDTDVGAEIRYVLPKGASYSAHNAEVSWSDNSAPVVTQSKAWSFTEGPYSPDNLFIEAEDFNYDGGQYVGDFTTKGFYAGKGGIHNVDYAQPGGGNDSDKYRSGESPNVNITEIVNNGILNGEGTRVGFDTVPDYKVGWNDPGDWYNYTRNFPDGNYQVYARLSSGGSDMHGELARVTSDRTQENQTLEVLGTFDGATTGNWDGFVFVPLRKNGVAVTLPLSGETTFRYSILPGNQDFNYLMFESVGTPDSPKFTSIELITIDGQRGVKLTWQGQYILEVADDVLGPWQKVDGATSPLLAPIDRIKRFARLRAQ